MTRLRAPFCSIVLAGLAVVALVLLGANLAPRRGQVMAIAWEAPETGVSSSGNYTTYVPIAVRLHDRGYVVPFGTIMYGDVNDAEGLQVMREAGSRWVTTFFVWSTVEPTEGTYDWSSFDAKALNASTAGMQVFALFTGNPTWAALSPDGPVSNTLALVKVTVAMAERYDCDGVDDAPGSPCVHYWSFYPEPDRESRWGHNGREFAAMLCQVSPAIRAADPQAQVLIGGLAYDWFVEDGGPFVRSFLSDTLLRLNATCPGGARAAIDAVAFHYYPISGERWPTIRDKALEIRSVMAQHGVGDLPLMCPEAGYWSSPKHGSSEPFQAQWLVQMYVRGLSVGIQYMAWYKVYDDAVAGSEADAFPDRTCGLLRLDGSRKPSYYAYQTMTRELEVARYLRPFTYPTVEGYVFKTPTGREKTVLWAQGAALNVPFPYRCLYLVDKLGTRQTIADGDPTNDLDGLVNGRVTLRVRTNDPAYVEPCY